MECPDILPSPIMCAVVNAALAEQKAAGSKCRSRHCAPAATIFLYLLRGFRMPSDLFFIMAVVVTVFVVVTVVMLVSVVMTVVMFVVMVVFGIIKLKLQLLTA